MCQHDVAKKKDTATTKKKHNSAFYDGSQRPGQEIAPIFLPFSFLFARVCDDDMCVRVCNLCDLHDGKGERIRERGRERSERERERIKEKERPTHAYEHKSPTTYNAAIFAQEACQNTHIFCRPKIKQGNKKRKKYNCPIFDIFACKWRRIDFWGHTIVFMIIR